MLNEVSTGFKTRLEYVLDQICAETRHGGSHEMRSFIAAQLMAATQADERSLDRLTEVARLALAAFLADTAAGIA
jgi:ribosomal protein S7